MLSAAAMGAGGLGHRATPWDLDTHKAESRGAFPICGKRRGRGGGTRCERARAGRGSRHVVMVGMMEGKVEAGLAHPGAII